MPETTASKSARRQLLIGVLGLLALLSVSVYGLFEFADRERESDIWNWQVRLGIVADSRVDAVNRWIAAQRHHLTQLAQNAALQEYLSRLQSIDGAAPEDGEAVEAVYLRNLIETAAARGDFSGRYVGPDVDANVERTGVAGIAVLDRSGNPVSSSSGMPPLSEFLANAVGRLPKTSPGLIDMHLGIAGTPSMGFSVPVFGVQGEGDASQLIGTIIGLKEVPHELFPNLKQPGIAEKTSEAILIRKNEAGIQYISPLLNGTPALKLTLDPDTPNLAAAKALAKPGRFHAGSDYRKQSVLAVSRRITGAPWVLLYKTDRVAALHATDLRVSNIFSLGGVLVLLVLAMIVGTWRWSVSVRSARMLAALEESNRTNEEAASFLRLLADSQHTEIFALTRDEKISFVNQTFADKLGMSRDDILGKAMVNVLGPAKTDAYRLGIAESLERGALSTRHFEITEPDGEHTYRVAHVPISAASDSDAMVLNVCDDLTDMMLEAARRDRALREFTRLLAMLVDHDDPYSIGHAGLVVEVAVGTARELKLPDLQVDTISMAACAVNLGKVLVDRRILIQPDQFDTEERRAIDSAQIAGPDFLEGIDFGLPVQETLEQIWEHWDGSGRPKGLKGEDIATEARVVAAAHAYVALVSRRAHRDAFTLEDAAEQLLGAADRVFDRRVVTALANFVENRGGKALLERHRKQEDLSARAQISVFRDGEDQ